MKAIVTGGNGFIGRNVVRELVLNGAKVISFDFAEPKEVIKGVDYVRGTIMDTFAMSKFFSDCDAVFHLAAVLGVKRADAELLRCMTINIEGTNNVFKAAVMNKVPYIMLASSSEIFGDITKGKITENHGFNPKSGYAISKLACEKYLEGFYREFGINYNICRLFNVYGLGQVAEFVIPKFVNMVKEKKSPQIYGDGNQVRSFCHISDTAGAIMGIFNKSKSWNQVFNIGNDLEPVTINELVNKVIKISNSDLIPKVIPFIESDRSESRETFCRIPDITKLSTIIGYKPKITLDKGIKEIFDFEDNAHYWDSDELDKDNK
jgi:UDP-glucose 4-epimerase